MKHKPLYQQMQEALYGDDPLTITLRKEALKTALDNAKALVDSGRLGCIILTEVIDVEKNTVIAHPYGEDRVVLETARMVMRDAGQRAAERLSKDMEAAQREEQPS